MFQNVIIGWIARRVPELVGLVTMLVTLYNSLPAQHQETIVAVLTGQGGGLTVSALIGLALYLWAQFMSYRATVKPQVVTSDGQKVAIAPNTRAASQIEAVAATAPKPRTLWERLTGS